MSISIVIRTKNEEAFLDMCLKAIRQQTRKDVEIILVDSGSIDQTVLIAKKHGVKIIEMNPEDFTYGRALNIGIQAAMGKVIVLLSAHAIPANIHWLEELVRPIFEETKIAGTFSRQIPRSDAFLCVKREIVSVFPKTGVSKHVLFSNVSSAIRKEIWNLISFDELLTGSEDLDWALKVQKAGWSVRYVPQSEIFHSHNESYKNILRRVYREALANRIIAHYPSLFRSLVATGKNFLADIFYVFLYGVSLQELLCCCRKFTGTLIGLILSYVKYRTEKNHPFPHS